MEAVDHLNVVRAVSEARGSLSGRRQVVGIAAAELPMHALDAIADACGIAVESCFSVTDARNLSLIHHDKDVVLVVDYADLERNGAPPCIDNEFATVVVRVPPGAGDALLKEMLGAKSVRPRGLGVAWGAAAAPIGV